MTCYQYAESALSEMTTAFSHSSYDDINEQYVKNSIESGRNQSQGVVATPDEIVRFMIKLAIEKYGKRIDQIRWYDPCSGSGKFPYQILKMAIEELNVTSEENLPEIYFSELSEDGYFATLSNLRNLLKESGLCIENYIESGRLKGFLGDALEINAQSSMLLSRGNICADVVIGNPPYVRSTRIEKSYKAKLKSLYPEIYNGSEDLYSYFFANATNIVEKNGLVCFISPQSFMKKKSSEPLRTFFKNNLHPISIIDLDENRIFDNVSLHTVITCMSKKPTDQALDYYHAFNSDDVNRVIKGIISYKKIRRATLSVKGWSFMDINMETNETKSLKEFGFKVRSGVRPAIKSAYVYGIGELQALPVEVIRKTIDAKGIKKWCTNCHSKELLFLTENNIENHALAESYLEQYKERLTDNKTKTSRNSWMSLRSCAYYDEMDKEKIIYPDISKELKFSLDKSSSYVLDGAFFIDTDDLTLLGILNSDFASNYFKAKCTSLGNVQNKGRLRIKKYFMEDFPLPSGFLTDVNKRNNISEIVKNIIENGESEEKLIALNKYVEEFYI
ncbi:TPA: Eco57I restriction-modification methylase domain-containing protein [Vibrio parahaemolyticus]|uniref:Eco57I restriction-modification methylase domain-containing protein n=1 Tax=Vibrio parahaemolyticus TaxID=670 RepID=UPI00215BD85A|nr:Eco57I restriction-modification methylase domain-containing protein [Vibrio parahaemolyticus]MCS0014515.1 Eco57I restriction-modification methylase domain-containing protein [Vibrio parahaemolyticus]HCM0880724.1 Eco57I restriction-modification methylase domain-containing protein [Vibrio parahaemolyticus]HCM0884487.1 Eco57I restriction-modification methylase domain-containing protein [Vibrio parahaemolyticus]